jgi:hypothetical protein
MSQESAPELETTISRTIFFLQKLAKNKRAAYFSRKCPVSKILKAKVTINNQTITMEIQRFNQRIQQWRSYHCMENALITRQIA